jgi:transcription elongation factor Elf1
VMQCPTCKGVKMVQSGIGSGIGIMISQCEACGGSGVLYTQAEMQAKDVRIDMLNEMIYIFKAENGAKDREIETLNKTLRKFGEMISEGRGDICEPYCAFYPDDCNDHDCPEGIVLKMRKQVEEETGRGGNKVKGKIDRDGWLWIERAGEMKIQECPYQSCTAKCGDWCPHFGELEKIVEELTVYLYISCGCDKTFAFGEFTDERGTK